jgi:ABC-2 type transport system ATP-binding protein
MDDAAVRFHEVRFAYGGRLALDQVSLTVPRGALFALLGANGAGKSTTLHLMTTLLQPSSGAISVCGHDSVQAPDAVRAALGYAPEEPLLFSGLTAHEFVELAGTLHGMGAAAASARAEVLLAGFGLGERRGDMLASFSKGMRRKALLAAALAHDPELLVLDEPMEGLDVVAQQQLKQLLRERVAAGGTVVYSTHVLEVIESLCSHAGVLRRGAVVGCGPVDDVRRQLGVARLEHIFSS